jgi:hypothetical protein
MLLAILSLLTGLSISGVAIYYSVAGLVSIFAAMPIPIIIMGVALESAKLVATVWLKANWERAPFFLKTYLMIAVFILMAVTSMGIFGYLSKAHSDQTLVSGDVMAKLNVYDEKIKVEKDIIATDRKALQQLDSAVDQIMSRSTDEKGASKASALRQSQVKERQRLIAEIDASNKKISKINEERAPIAAENRKVEAEVGPIKYIAALLYGDNPDANVLEKAVRWVIIMIVIVFDPLAVILLLASQYSFAWRKEDQEAAKPKDEVVTPTPEVVIPIPVPTPVPEIDLDAINHELAQAAVVPEPIVPEKEPPATSFTPPESWGTTPITKEDFNDPELKEFFDRSKAVAQALDKGQPIPETTADQIVPVDEVIIPEEPVHAKASVGPRGVNPLANLRNTDPQPTASEEMGIEAWNKMLEAAEAEAVKESEARKLNVNQRGQFTEVIEPENKFAVDYVQNEEQLQSSVWNKTISNLEYEKTATDVQIKELIDAIDRGTVDIINVTDAEKKAIENYLSRTK